MPDPEPTRSGDRWGFSEPIAVTFRDLDIAGHVNNSVVFTWMETVRLHYYMQASGVEDPSNIDFILAEAAARYLVPVRYQHKVRAEIAPSHVGRTSWTVLYRFVDEPSRTVLMRGRSVQVSYDYRTLRKKPLPDAMRERFLKDMVSAESEGWPPEQRSPQGSPLR